MYDEFIAKEPKCAQHKRIALCFAQGADFAARFNDYLRPLLRKGTAAAFKTVKGLFSDAEKAKQIEE